MRIRDVQNVIERWAPRTIAWEKDNVGLAIGNTETQLRGILVALDVTERTVAEAAKRRANLLISHHPLLFRPIRSIRPDDQTGRCVEALLREKIALYSAHTNLDFTRGGTSFALAAALGLHKVDFLVKSYQVQKKIITFVPRGYVDKVMRAMVNAGAGTIGNYDMCSFRTDGTGTFRGNQASRPATGQREKFEHVPETRLEMVVPEWRVNAVVIAMKSAHPYEEVAYDILTAENVSNDYGMGIVGELDRPMEFKRFVSLVKRSLGARALRYTTGVRNTIRRVAACGGSGSDLTDEAVKQRCDAFVTADVKYHSFHNAAGRIALIDAGHYETEHPVVRAVVRHLKEEFQRIKQNVPVYAARTSTNPIIYV